MGVDHPGAEPGQADEKDLDEILKEQLRGLLNKHFRPAAHAGDATTMMTTPQLFSVVDEHSPGIIPKDFFRGAMLALGYQEQFIGENFVWLLKAL